MPEQHDEIALLHDTAAETLHAYTLLRRAAERARAAHAPSNTITALDVARTNAAAAYTAASEAERQAQRRTTKKAHDEATASTATNHQVASKEHEA